MGKVHVSHTALESIASKDKSVSLKQDHVVIYVQMLSVAMMRFVS